MRWLYVALVFAGCASAGQDMPEVGSRPDGGGGGMTMKDGSTEPLPDAAPLPDAPMGQQQVTLSQTNNLTPAAGEGLACGHSFLGTTIATADNSWYRVFKLADHGINGAFQLQRVVFWSDYAWAGTSTSQPATVKIGTYSGTLEATTLTPASITPITSKPIMIPDNTGAPAQVVTDLAATIPAGSNLIVEVALPDGDANGDLFYIGVSSGGEMKKGYIRATPSGCGFTTPTSLTAPAPGLNQPTNSVLLTVTGTK